MLITIIDNILSRSQLKIEPRYNYNLHINTFPYKESKIEEAEIKLIIQPN